MSSIFPLSLCVLNMECHLQSLEAEQVAAVEHKRQFPMFKPGDVLELKVVGI